jgi:antitoxin (DNA-binding transcriptional repressor) of toxin-antitoxin stability system
MACCQVAAAAVDHGGVFAVVAHAVGVIARHYGRSAENIGFVAEVGDGLPARGTARCGRVCWCVTAPIDQPVDVSVRQFVADSGSVTRGLRQGRAYTLTLNGEFLARMIPIRRAVRHQHHRILGRGFPCFTLDTMRERVLEDYRE